MVATAFKPPPELFTRPPTLLPAHPTLENFQRVLTETGFLTFFRNSTIVAITTTAIVLVVSALGAHAIVSFRIRGRELIGQVFLLAYMLPSTAVLIPLYLIIARLGLTNPLLGLIVAYTSLILPFSLWMMRAFFEGIPREVEQAALIDGASRLEAFVDVVLPQAVPGIIATGVFSFILCWNEYLFAMVMINKSDMRTLPVGVIASLITGQAIEWGMVMAAASMMAVPLLIAFLFLQRFVVEGFGAGAVKG
jgi:ABC-type glycerol-3-phosphate transport system permease component